jgi:hypothetical protein
MTAEERLRSLEAQRILESASKDAVQRSNSR